MTKPMERNGVTQLGKFEFQSRACVRVHLKEEGEEESEFVASEK